MGTPTAQFGRPQGHLDGVTLAVADPLVPMNTEVTPVNERIMRLRITHTLSVISLVSLCAPTAVSANGGELVSQGGYLDRPR